MALIPPPPNNNLSEDSQTDAIWKGWFERIRYLINNNVISTAWTSLTGNITSAQLRAAISDEVGTGFAVFPSGTPDGTKYLRDDATWQPVSGSSGSSTYFVLGEQGEDGPPGPPGQAGAAGTTGAAGAAGVDGSRGSPGADGDDGEPGIPGATGSTGATGSQGIQGIAGAMGPPGFEGEDGEDAPVIVGPQGPAGTAGSNGSSGVNGPPGIDGEDGELAIVMLQPITIAGGSSTKTVGVVFDGGGSPPTAGSVGYLVCQTTGTIDQWSIVADTSGSAVVDVWKAAGAIPTDANRIAGTEKLTLSAQQLASDTSLSTWTTAVTAGDVFGFELESVSTCTRLTCEVRLTT
jgi:hypothetical protein